MVHFTYTKCGLMSISCPTAGNPKYAECLRHCRVHNIAHSANIIFAKCILKSTQQTSDTGCPMVLTSAGRTTLGEQHCLPRVSSGHLVLYLFAKCLDKGTRQNVSPHARKTRPLCPLPLWAVILCRVPPQSTRYLITLPSAYTRALGKLGPRMSPLPWESRDGHYCLPSG